MIDTEILTINECMNEGDEIHMYYDSANSVWKAYGLSAYLLYHISEEYMNIPSGYSKEIQMPYAKVDDKTFEALFFTHTKKQAKDQHLKFRLTKQVDVKDYAKWLNCIDKK